MKLSKIVFLFLAVFLISSCASPYKLINPSLVDFKVKNSTDDVSIKYKYNLLHKAYAKKEKRRGVELVAVQIINNSDKDLIFGQDLSLTNYDGSKLYIMDKENAYESLKQSQAPFLFYLLFPPIRIDPLSGIETQYRLEYSKRSHLIGPILMLINILSVEVENKHFKEELDSSYLENQTIKMGDTLSGLIGIKSNSYDEIRIKLK